MVQKPLFCFITIVFLFSIFYLQTYANGIALTPPFQDILASDSAAVSYTNFTNNPVTLNFSLQKITATDLLGRLQFNVPLPQTLESIPPELAIINPNKININPGETATVSAIFNPSKLNPGTSAFLLLAQVGTASPSANGPLLGTNITQYLGSSILVTAIGGHTTNLELLKKSLPSFPLYFRHPDFFQLTLRNTGNTRSVPRGVVITKDIFGREIMRGVINRDSSAVLPGSQRLIYGHLQPSQFSWPININKLSVSGSDDIGQSRFSFSYTYLFVHPLLIPTIFFVFLVILLINKNFR